MMAEKEKDDTTSSNGEEESEQPWGTLEELLLACAVNRHGIDSWNSIAGELHARTNKPFSPHACNHKYADLTRRFSDAGDSSSGDETDVALMRVVDELRKIRVEELKREVHRHDVSIVSLELKVKRLEEERESKAEEGPDLRTGTGPERSSPEKVDSAEGGRSFNESNSTNHNKAEEEEKPEEREPEEKCQTEPDTDPVRSCTKTEPDGGSKQGTLSRASRPGEFASESKRESAKQQQSSDVQSSASLSKKKRRRFRCGGSSGDDLEADEVSPANKRINVKSQPLIRFLEILRSHKHGSVFQRRLPSQETEKYRNVIRQHMDLETVQSRLDKGVYCDCHPKFYRDLLLIFTNAVMFYRKSSAEHLAARELRKMVIDEIVQSTRKPIQNIQPVKSNPDPQLLEPVVKKPRSSTAMVVCRRRSSSSMQALSDSMKKKDEHSNNNTTTTNNKDNSNENVDDKSNGKSSSNKVEKSKGGGDLPPKESEKKSVTRERSGLGRGGGVSKKSESSSSKKSSVGDGVEVVAKKKINSSDQKQQPQEKGTTTLKKQGVANFLKRMTRNEEEEKEGGQKIKRGGNTKKGNSSSSTRPEVEAIATYKKRGGGETETTMTTRRSGNNGRPPKRKVAMVSTPESGKGGRSGSGGEKSKKKARR